MCVLKESMLFCLKIEDRGNAFALNTAAEITHTHLPILLTCQSWGSTAQTYACRACCFGAPSVSARSMCR